MKYIIHYKNRVGFGMYAFNVFDEIPRMLQIEAQSIEEAIKIFYQENRGCTIDLLQETWLIQDLIAKGLVKEVEE